MGLDRGWDWVQGQINSLLAAIEAKSASCSSSMPDTQFNALGSELARSERLSVRPLTLRAGQLSWDKAVVGPKSYH